MISHILRVVELARWMTGISEFNEIWSKMISLNEIYRHGLSSLFLFMIDFHAAYTLASSMLL